MKQDRILSACVGLFALPALALGVSDWGNYGGNAQRNGISPELGPVDDVVLWEAPGFSLITWHPFIADGTVYLVRETGFPQAGGAANDEIVALDLATGAEQWAITLPYAGDPDAEWIAWIGGVNDGRLYASRSDNGRNLPLRAIDAATGDLLWESDAPTRAWAHDGIVFAPDGDPIVGDFDSITRINAEDGATVWETMRSCPVSGNCGAALYNGAVYVDQAAPGGNVIVKYDLATGAELYQSPLMPGFTDQNAPFIAPDGTVYLSRTQNNDLVDFLYAFQDTGAAFVEKWNAPVRWTTSHEHGIGPDGSIYTFSRDNELIRLDPATGNVIATSAPLPILGTGNVSPKTVVDAQGNVYISNGWASTPETNGRVWAFEADLQTMRFELELDRPNAGGPVLGDNGTLVVADRQGVYAYQTEPPVNCPGDFDGNLVINSADLNILLTNFGNPAKPDEGDFNRDGIVNSIDLNGLLSVFGDTCKG